MLQITNQNQDTIGVDLKRQYLHATEANPNRRGSALLAFAYLIGFLLLRGVVPMLACSHFQVENAWNPVPPC